jgi:large subunit ribosomal protein L29
MKSLRSTELRGHADQDLKRMIGENEARMVALNFQKITGHLEKPAQISTLRRDIARIKTVLRERALEAAAAIKK